MYIRIVLLYVNNINNLLYSYYSERIGYIILCRFLKNYILFVFLDSDIQKSKTFV